jgi:hypothetical protein
MQQVNSLSATELIMTAFLRGGEVYPLWQEFKRNCDEDDL